MITGNKILIDMEIGNAIKTLRIRRNISQKDLANMVGITAPSLSQIENNAVFPHKKTITKVCSVLQIPSSYLLLFSIEAEDVPEDKRPIFNTMNKMIKELLLEDLTELPSSL